MSVIYMNGMEHYLTSGLTGEIAYPSRYKYDATVANAGLHSSAGSGRRGTMGNTGSVESELYLPEGALTDGQTIICGCAYKQYGQLDHTSNKIMSINEKNVVPDLIGDKALAVYWSPITGGPVLLNHTNAEKVPTNNLGFNQYGYNYFEIKLRYGVDGLHELRYGGEVIYSEELDTTYGGTVTDVDAVSWFSTNNAIELRYNDEFYIVIDDGVGICDYIGDARIDTLYPTSDRHVDFYPKVSNNNYQEVGETLLDMSQTAVESGSLNAYDQYSYTELTDIGIDHIFSIQPGLTVLANSASTITSKQQLYLGEQTIEGDEFTVPSTEWKFLSSALYDNNPWTSARWTEADINQIEAGFSLETLS